MKTRYRATLHLFSGNYSLATISNYLALTQVEHRGSWIICTLDMTIGQEIPYTRSRLILIAAPARRVHSRDFCLLVAVAASRQGPDFRENPFSFEHAR
jgi:hypothetical protein